MLIFIGVAVVLTVVVMLLLWRSMRQTAVQGGHDRRLEQSIDAARTRLAELTDEAKQGLVGADDVAAQRADLEQDLAQWLGGDADQPTPAPSPERANRWLLPLSIVAVAAGSLLTYLQVGTPQAFELAEQQAAMSPEQRRLVEEVGALEQAIDVDPDSKEAWQNLARFYMQLSAYEQAAAIYQGMRQQFPDDREARLQYVGAAALAQRGFSEDSLAILDQVLEEQPDSSQALWLSGMAAQARGDVAAATSHWQRIIDNPSAPSAMRLQAQAALNSANQSGADQQSSFDNDARIDVRVTMPPALAKGLDPATTIFVFARGDAPFPLAVQRLTVGDLPAEMTLDQRLAMRPEARLETGTEVTVGARVSIEGQASAGAGDIQSLPLTVTVGPNAEVDLIIDQMVE
ncbi:c-type cytochrome biogenesis protein CcmI [Gammaproteobacteria bacterium]|nr:c-type cytochrome biogenesis protein CcmI [Gammaproteobacteria bacterium]